MASICKQPGSAVWWVSYYRDGRRVRQSLKTRDERIAKKKARRIEAELVTGELEEQMNTPLVPLLETFCEHLETTRTRKSYKHDLSYLRTVFGPVCEALKPGSTLDHRHAARNTVAVPDQLAGRHVSVTTLEALTPGVIECHLAQKGESLYRIATLMGNSPEVGWRHYAALIPEEMRDTVEFDVRPRVVQPDGEVAQSA